MKMHRLITVLMVVGFSLALAGCDKSKPELDKAQAELTAAQAELTTVKADLAKKQANMAEMQTAKDAVSSELEKAKTDLTAATTVKDQMQQQIDTLTKEKADAIAKATAESKTTIDKLQEEITKLKALVETLQTQLKGATGGVELPKM